MRPHYAEYVKHAMRFYAKSRINASSEQPRFKTEADKKNWNACQTALNTYSDEEREVFVALYSDTAPLPEAIAKIAKEHHMEQNHVWNMVNDLEKKVAKRRGLI